ncbi:MAG: tRNA pseudouridine(38-40) synthase TruA [Puniceicoccales bacterium]|jgi:tRNA pseudouridine38-40 synthase|nr:tRNA pseudouridine(38-40) synthase TruA [Puniceicoccales bacterium]
MDIRRPNQPLIHRRNDLPHGFTRFVGTVAYDGTDFHGWQSQPDGNTIQDILERRLTAIFRIPIRVHGSGRTDSGVHARGQVFHFDARWPHSIEVLQTALRTGLPAGIRVTSMKTGKANFHARYSAYGKRYRYYIYEGFAPPMEVRYCFSTGERKLDTKRMVEAAVLLTGVHDFSAFGGRNRDSSESDNPIKDLRRLDVARRGARVTVTTEASGYLYKMVRRLAGGLIEVGTGKLTPQELLAYRDAQVSSSIVPAAPAAGLVMEKVFYKLPANTNITPEGETGSGE